MTASGFTMKWVVRQNDFPNIVAGMEQRAGQFVRKAALDIEAEAKKRAPVRTGTLRNSIQAVKGEGPLWYRVVVGAEYGVYVEWGTRFMAAQPYLRPAVTAVSPSFLEAMKSVSRP